ncbi:MAG: hypothetical protein PHG85_05830 [Candidatus Altiarchaeota archaeon]|nr:hypothetical protein [Candidatus Altiarchaeota archaeon]
MKKRFVLEVVKDEKKKDLSVQWDSSNMTYPEMLGYMDIAKDRLKERAGYKMGWSSKQKK